MNKTLNLALGQFLQQNNAEKALLPRLKTYALVGVAQTL